MYASKYGCASGAFLGIKRLKRKYLFNLQFHKELEKKHNILKSWSKNQPQVH